MVVFACIPKTSRRCSRSSPWARRYGSAPSPCPRPPGGAKVRLVNEPVKAAWVAGQLLIEVHPPVDAEGQSIEPDVQVLEPLLDQVLGNDTAAIHWDLARDTRQGATGVPTRVGLAAEPDSQSDTSLASTPDPGTR